MTDREKMESYAHTSDCSLWSCEECPIYHGCSGETDPATRKAALEWLAEHRSDPDPRDARIAELEELARAMLDANQYDAHYCVAHTKEDGQHWCPACRAWVALDAALSKRKEEANK